MNRVRLCGRLTTLSVPDRADRDDYVQIKYENLIAKADGTLQTLLYFDLLRLL